MEDETLYRSSFGDYYEVPAAWFGLIAFVVTFFGFIYFSVTEYGWFLGVPVGVFWGIIAGGVAGAVASFLWPLVLAALIFLAYLVVT